MKDYDKVIELSPRLAGVYFERGYLKNQMGRHYDALEDFNISIELFPYNPLAYLYRGDTLCLLENNEKAVSDYEAYLKLNPDADNAEEIKNKIEGIKNCR